MWLVSGFLAALRAGHLVAAGGVRDGLIFTEARQRGTLLVNWLQAFGHGGAQCVGRVDLPKLDIKFITHAVCGGEKLCGRVF